MDAGKPEPDIGEEQPRAAQVPLLRRAEQKPLIDLYHRTMALPLWGILVGMAATFVAINVLFGALYLMHPEGVLHLPPGDLLTAFFFSVQTFGTIGYGYMSPVSNYANGLVSLETFVGLVYVALATGLVFARVSRPTAKVLFSRVAVVETFDGLPTLMFRAANRRANQILEAEVQVSLARDLDTREGRKFRRFEELRVVRARTPLFALTWTVMHPIDEMSPLWGADASSLVREQAELIVVLSGVDDRFAQRVHARHAYIAEDVVWGGRFADVLSTRPDGRRVVDYRRFHVVEDA
jgi:inward rectifier potassium channel